jgi:hypothetical protein
MTGDGVPANPSVLNTTILSNFAYIDQQDSLESAQFQSFARNSNAASMTIRISSQLSTSLTTKFQS